MTGWFPHDGKGVPKDAKPGVTQIRIEAFPGHVLRGGTTVDAVWYGDHQLFDWVYYGRPVRDGSGNRGICPRITHYRNPSTNAAVEALKQMIREPEHTKA